jgi:hypothetical protein
MLRLLIKTLCLGLAGAISLGVSAVATASPRDRSEMGVQVSAPARSRTVESARYRMAGWNIAAPDPGAWSGPVARRQNRSKAHYRSGEHSVAQISPAIHRRTRLSLEDAARPPCAAKARGDLICRAKAERPKGLVEALLEAPTPATQQSLKQIGIPAVKDVPPIAILRAATPGVDEHGIAASR